MKALLGKPDGFVRAYALVSIAVGGLAITAASVLFLGGLAPMCTVLPLYSASCLLAAPLFWELRRVRLDMRGRFTRLAIELIAFSFLTAAVAVWWRMHPGSC